tara:strand:+ start:127 stop:318 length:192 start_codon:yes stop_codon:yes gene_type:complete
MPNAKNTKASSSENKTLKVNDHTQLDGVVVLDGTKVMVKNLPTADPQKKGQLWVDAGALKVSQ